MGERIDPTPAYEPHDSAHRHPQPWGSHQVEHYTLEQEKAWKDYVDGLVARDREAQEIVEETPEDHHGEGS
jgi:hypothetical protein